MLQSDDYNWHLLKLIVHILLAWLGLAMILHFFGYSDQTHEVSSLLSIVFSFHPISLYCKDSKLVYQLLAQIYDLKQTKNQTKKADGGHTMLSLCNHLSCFLQENEILSITIIYTALSLGIQSRERKTSIILHNL